MSKDIKALLSIYTILILVGWNIGLKISHKNEIKKLNNELFEAKKVAVEINQAKDIYIEMLQSMNNYADGLESELNEYKYLEKLKKDLAKSK